MYRIGVMMAGLAIVFGLSTGPASARSCDDRIAESCPAPQGPFLSLPEAEPAEATNTAETPRASRRTRQVRVKKRARRDVQTARRGAQGRTARALRKKPARAAIVRKRQPIQEIDENDDATAPAAVLDAGRKETASEVPPVPAVPPVTVNAAAGAMPGSVSALSSTFTSEPAGLSASAMSAAARSVAAPLSSAADMMTGSAPFDRMPRQDAMAPAAAAPAAVAPSPQPPVKVAMADNALPQSALPASAPQQAAASASLPGPAETSWMRVMIMAFGGLLAAGSVIRMVM